MRRDVGLHARFLLPALAVLAVVGCGSSAVATFSLQPGASCACATQPGPTGTPPPVTASQAENAVARIVQAPARYTDLVHGPSGRLMWQVTAVDAIAFVDAVTGGVLEVVFTDAMPDHDVVMSDVATELAAAEAFMARFVGLTEIGGTESITAISRGEVGVSVVSWTDPGASPGVARRVYVNRETRAVFAFVSASPSFDPVVPVVGKVRAGELALAAVNWPGMTVLAAEWSLYFALDGSQLSTWMVALGEPSSTQADVYIHGAAVEVDAATGATTIMKSDVGTKP